MKKEKYIELTSRNVASIKQSYYDEINSINKLMLDYDRELNVIESKIIGIDEELKYIKRLIKNTILQIKLVQNNIWIDDELVYNEDNDKDINLNYKFNELTRLKRKLIYLNNRKKELLNEKKSSKTNIKLIRKNVEVCKKNVCSINVSLVTLDDLSVYYNGYVNSNRINPKLKQTKRLK